jgi:hypothetical protein
VRPFSLPGWAADNGGIMTEMPKRKAKERAEADDPLATYRRVRKRVPPPGRVVPDRREKLRGRAERQDREAEQDPTRTLERDGA